MFILRLNADGTPDRTFGQGGRLTLDDESHMIVGGGANIALQHDGRIVIASTVDARTKRDPDNQDLYVFRLLPDGRRDRSFGNKGSVRTDLGGIDNALDLAIDADGRLVVAGFRESWKPWDQLPWSEEVRGRVVGTPKRSLVPEEFIVVRHAPDGSLDRSFAEGGIFRDDMDGKFGYADNIAIAPDGTIIGQGGFWGGGNDMGKVFVQKLNPDGSRIESFGDGGDGNLVLAEPFSVARMLVQPDGKVLLAGGAWEAGVKPGFGAADLAVRRLNPDGSPDTTYGEGGTARATRRDDDNAIAAALGRDGKLVVAGSGAMSDLSDDTEILITRFEGGAGSGGSRFGTLRRGYDQQAPKKAKQGKAKKKAKPGKLKKGGAPAAPAPKLSLPLARSAKVLATEPMGPRSLEDLLD